MYAEALKTGRKIFAVAPMIDWTDKTCLQGAAMACRTVCCTS